MSVPASRLLTQLNEGRSCACFKINLADPRAVEIAGIAGADAVWLCNEHVANDWLNLEHLIRAARIYRMDAMIRVAKGSYSDYVKPLEAGAHGIVVPNVTSAAEAKQIVEMTRFHPMGKRAIDGGNVDGSFAATSAADYISSSNANQFIALQIESPEGAANVEEIAAVDGFQFLFFGPGDFSHKSGIPGQLNDPIVVETRRKVEEAAARHGKWVMTTGVPVESRRESGPEVVVAGSDVTALGEVFRRRLAEYREVKVAPQNS